MSTKQQYFEVQKIGYNRNENAHKKSEKEIFIEGMELSYDYMTNKTVKISEFYNHLESEVGYSARLFSRAWYEAMRFHPAIDQEKISSPREVDSFFK